MNVLLLAHYTGWAEADILAMPTHRARGYFALVPWLRARLMNDQITATSYPHLSESSQADISAEIKDALDARPDHERFADGLAAMKRRFGNGRR